VRTPSLPPAAPAAWGLAAPHPEDPETTSFLALRAEQKPLGN